MPVRVRPLAPRQLGKTSDSTERRHVFNKGESLEQEENDVAKTLYVELMKAVSKTEGKLLLSTVIGTLDLVKFDTCNAAA